MTSIGIVSVGTYSPEVYGFGRIAAATGYPEWVVRDKLGIQKKYVGGPDDHPNEMGIKAALDCLAQTDIDPLKSTSFSALPRMARIFAVDIRHPSGV